MKVFWLTKYTEDKLFPLYRCMVEPENIYSIKLNENIPFNILIITNPENSNSIYTLHQLYLSSNENNILKLYMTDNVKLHSKGRKFENLEFSCLANNNINDSSMTELSTIACASNLLNDNYLILIPGGNIIIKTNVPILKGELSMKYTIEEL